MNLPPSTDFSQSLQRVWWPMDQAMTHEDVAEFLRRINLSQFFVSTELVSTDLGPAVFAENKAESGQSMSMVRFEIVGEVRYR